MSKKKKIFIMIFICVYMVCYMNTSAISENESVYGNGTQVNVLAPALTENLLNDDLVWELGEGWSGNYLEGFAHISGNEALAVDLNETGSHNYVVEFTAGYALKMNDLKVSVGASKTFDTYIGYDGEPNITYSIGVKSVDGSKIFFFPSEKWQGIITNIKVYRIISINPAGSYVVDENGNELFEQRYNKETLDNVWLGENVGQYNVTGYGNVGLGEQALANNISGFWNVSIGKYCLLNNTAGSRNIAIGQSALMTQTVGLRNVAIGSFAMAKLEKGNQNIALGVDSMIQAKSGSNNIGIGYVALGKNAGGNDNIALGKYTLNNNTTGSYNIAIGAESLTKNITGQQNVALGYHTLYNKKSGNSNVAVGHGALQGSNGDSTYSYNVAVGSRAGYSVGNYGQGNVFVGYNAGDSVTTGQYNIIIGYDTDTPAANTSKYLNIGNIITGDMNEDNRQVQINGGLSIYDLPITDPGVPGMIWNDNGTLKVSMQENLAEYDINGDGAFDASDIIVLRKSLAYNEDPGTVGDTNEDGQFDIRDLVFIKKQF